MKKLMIAVAVVAGAICANAANVNWTMTNIKKSGTTDNQLSGKDMCYLFVDDGTFTSTVLANYLTSVTSQSDLDDYLGTHSIGQTALTDDGKVDTSFKVPAAVKTGDNNMFALIVENAGKDAALGDIFVVTATKTFANDGASDVGASFASQKSLTQTADNWKSIGTSAVPEPTSGLLLLLGIGAMALRRRHA